MGRGLSELQKTMLTMPVDEHGQIYVKDVVTKYYGWKQSPNGHFNKKEIGPKQYISTYIAIRKSLKRLSDRGLICCIGRSKFELINEGRELSAKLISSMVKPFDLDQIAVPNAKKPSMCSLYDGIYECVACGVKFEPFGAKSFPLRCPFCGKATLQRYHVR